MGASFIAQNGGKKSITLNLKLEGGKEIFRRLVTSADVLVENFRPGVMDRLGLGYSGARRRSILGSIYCAISGFGQDGPMQRRAGVRPDRPGHVGCDEHHRRCAAARRCVWAIRSATASADSPRRSRSASALVGRERTGEGRFIDVSMLDSTIATMGWVVSNYLIAGRRAGTDGQRELHRGAIRHIQNRQRLAEHRGEHRRAVRRAGELIERPDLLEAIRAF